MNQEGRMRVTLDRIAKFEGAIADAVAKAVPEDVDPVIWKAHIAGMEAMLVTLKAELQSLSAGDPRS